MRSGKEEKRRIIIGRMPDSSPRETPKPPMQRTAPADQDIEALLQELRQQGLADVALVQTHISWLLMGGQRVWKIKKPVHLPFLDFRTLAQRQHCCEEELRLNRRFAPELYLGLRPLWRDAAGRLRWHAPDTPTTNANRIPSEWAVEMQRFPADALLSARLTAAQAKQARTHHAPVANAAIGPAADPVSAPGLHALGQRLAQFHAQASAANPDPRYGSPELIRAEVDQVLRTLRQGALAAHVPAWQAWVEAQSQRLWPLWQARQRLVREGHGDLHLGNLVVLGDAIAPFDGIEFQPAMRWLDPVNDIAFLSMDLHAHGRSDLAAHLMDGWLQTSGDYAGLGTWRFYEVYRALVRAMVAQLTPGQAAQGQRYVDLLDRWTAGTAAQAAPAAPANAPHRPPLLITCGLSGSGKSTVAAAVMARLGAVRLRSDVERKRLFGLAALEDSAQRGLNIYTPEATARTFARLGELAAGALEAGWPVVIDAAFLRREQRDAMHALARQRGLPFAILHCQAPEAVLRQRIALRQNQGQDPSEATADVLARQQQWLEPLDDGEQAVACHIDTRQRDWLTACLDDLAKFQIKGKHDS